MADGNRHYFVYGNTAQGFINKLPSNLQGVEKLFILRGRPGSGKACFMAPLAEECEKTGLRLEYLHCPSAPDTYDGIIVPDLRLAVIDGTDLHYTMLITSDPEARYIDMDAALDASRLTVLEEPVSDIISEIGKCHENAFQCFRDALSVHDEWEKIYIENMDFQKADTLASAIIDLMLGDCRFEKPPVMKERFFGASTPAGATDYIERLTGSIAKRYLLKGRPGTGKSTLLRKLAAASTARGLDTEIYSCAFDSNSLDMIIWPELDKCLFDSTAPHLYEPSRPEDEVIDTYSACVRPGTDEKYEKELADISLRYKEAVGKGTRSLSVAKGYLDALIGIYSATADSDHIRGLCTAFAEQLR
ncbi:MAG: hypothetical protein GXY05_01845 [Clostridiales bacterium]|nr:hypothetical protein [Clostridiales bacterium]